MNSQFQGQQFLYNGDCAGHVAAANAQSALPQQSTRDNGFGGALVKQNIDLNDLDLLAASVGTTKEQATMLLSGLGYVLIGNSFVMPGNESVFNGNNQVLQTVQQPPGRPPNTPQRGLSPACHLLTPEATPASRARQFGHARQSLPNSFSELQPNILNLTPAATPANGIRYGGHPRQLMSTESSAYHVGTREATPCRRTGQVNRYQTPVPSTASNKHLMSPPNTVYSGPTESFGYTSMTNPNGLCAMPMTPSMSGCSNVSMPQSNNLMMTPMSYNLSQSSNGSMPYTNNLVSTPMTYTTSQSSVSSMAHSNDLRATPMSHSLSRCSNGSMTYSRQTSAVPMTNSFSASSCYDTAVSSQSSAPTPFDSSVDSTPDLIQGQFLEDPFEIAITSIESSGPSSQDDGSRSQGLGLQFDRAMSTNTNADGQADLHGCITETGFTNEDVESYVGGPDANDGKWYCMFPDCDRRFNRKENIRSHIQTHLGDRPYLCSICDKRFVRQHDLKRHSKIHFGAKPYQCPCGASFARHDALTRHRQRGMCIGAFEGIAKTPAKRGRPKKNRPEMEERQEKAAKTRKIMRAKSSSAESTDFLNVNKDIGNTFSSPFPIEDAAVGDFISSSVNSQDFVGGVDDTNFQSVEPLTTRGVIANNLTIDVNAANCANIDNNPWLDTAINTANFMEIFKNWVPPELEPSEEGPLPEAVRDLGLTMTAPAAVSAADEHIQTPTEITAAALPELDAFPELIQESVSYPSTAASSPEKERPSNSAEAEAIAKSSLEAELKELFSPWTANFCARVLTANAAMD